jgi:hypothetical protein
MVRSQGAATYSDPSDEWDGGSGCALYWQRSGHNYPECAGAYAVMKRGVHDTDFTVSGYVYPSSSGLHPYLLHLESIQILVGLMPEKGPQSGTNEILAINARRRAHP